MVWAIRSGARRWQGNFHPTFPEALTQQVLLLLEPSLLLLKQGQSIQLPERARPGSTMSSESSPQEPTARWSKLCPEKSWAKSPWSPDSIGFAPLREKATTLYLSKGNSVSRRFKEFDFDAKWVLVTKYKNTCILDLALHKSLCATFPLTKCVTLGKLFIFISIKCC